jgi:hypothetical protein
VGASLLHQSMHGSAASSAAPASLVHGTSTCQLHGMPMHDVVLESWGWHRVGFTGDGVVVKSLGQPNPEPDELPEPPPDDPPELELLVPPSPPLTIV